MTINQWDLSVHLVTRNDHHTPVTSYKMKMANLTSCELCWEFLDDKLIS